ncbi:MAG TPA: UDP-glucuronic acid decarboxylase family protein [Chloroflexota bacterium]
MEYLLVSGGAGFIGSHLCAALLERDFFVVCVDNLSTGSRDNIAGLLSHPRFHFLPLDILELDQARLAAEGVDHPFRYVFHLASPASVVDYLRLPLETLLVNGQGTQRLLELARVRQARFLYTSTSEIYGDPLVHPQPEEYWGNVNPNGPRSCYDEGKRYGEALTAQYGRSFGLDARIVRIFNTYGPHSRIDDGRVVPNFIGQALRGEPISIYGSGTQTRSFCYVSDLVAGLIAAMFTPGVGGEVFNLGNPEEHTILEFGEIVARLCGVPSPLLSWSDLPTDDPSRRQPVIDKAIRLLGWQPAVSLEDGLRHTIAWFRSRVSRASMSVDAGSTQATSGLIGH